jgi:O-glycosyl hydrolase
VRFPWIWSFTSDNGISPGNDHLKFLVLADNPKQTIQNFGASDAWSIQFVGKNWPEQKRQKIAELLFSNENDDASNPRGIGLSAWRFNLGAGSAQQGVASDIQDAWRRAPGMLRNDGSYDLEALEGQRNFLRMAQSYGVDQFIAFVNSPPVQFTKNGKAYSSGGSSTNLKNEHFVDYAVYLKTALETIKAEDGIAFNYLSPFNEPQWNWDHSGQEGCPWRNSEIASTVRIIDSVFASTTLPTKVELSDAGKLTYLYENDGDATRGSQIEAFFSNNSVWYIGDLEVVAKKISGHSYYTTYNNKYLLSVRENLRAKVKEFGSDFSFWQTEYCILEDNEEIQGPGRDLGIESALYMDRVIHTDLTVANSETWQWWLAVSPYDYKDGLVYIDYNKDDGDIYESKILWTLGHYSRFIKQGAKRYDMWRSDNKSVEQSIDGIYASSYRNSDGSWVIVITNQSDIDIPVQVGIKDLDDLTFKLYETNADPETNLDFTLDISSDETIEVKGRSIITLVSDTP